MSLKRPISQKVKWGQITSSKTPRHQSSLSGSVTRVLRFFINTEECEFTSHLTNFLFKTLKKQTRERALKEHFNKYFPKSSNRVKQNIIILSFFSNIKEMKIRK